MSRHRSFFPTGGEFSGLVTKKRAEHCQPPKLSLVPPPFASLLNYYYSLYFRRPPINAVTSPTPLRTVLPFLQGNLISTPYLNTPLLPVSFPRVVYTVKAVTNSERSTLDTSVYPTHSFRPSKHATASSSTLRRHFSSLLSSTMRVVLKSTSSVRLTVSFPNSRRRPIRRNTRNRTRSRETFR